MPNCEGRSRRSGVILYSDDNDHFVVYTSPPPAAELLLKEKPFGGRSFQLSLIVAFDSCSQPLPRGTPILIGVGWRSQTMGESRKRTEESLLSSGRFRLSPATGHIPASSSNFTQAAFISHTGSLLLSSLKKVTSPSFPRIPRPSPHHTPDRRNPPWPTA